MSDRSDVSDIRMPLRAVFASLCLHDAFTATCRYWMISGGAQGASAWDMRSDIEGQATLVPETELEIQISSEHGQCDAPSSIDRVRLQEHCPAV